MAIDPITAALEAGKLLIARIWPDPADQAKAQLDLKELAQKGDLAELNARITLLAGQLEINKIEAGSDNLFVSGWRPFIGWVCGLALAYAAIFEPILRFIASICGYSGEFPVIDTSITMQVLLGMLGLGAMRTREKEKGVAREKL